jgi:hypothetical protein
LSLALSSLSYLGIIVSDIDDNLPAVEYHIQKSRIACVRIGKIIRKQSNCDPEIIKTFYKEISQSVLLYGAESWVINSAILSKFE